MNKDDELLSVIVPIYNTERYLEQCIESIINQDYTKLDIILVDDGSTDYSGIIADRYREDYRIRVVHKKNEGLLKARFEGLQKAEGSYVTFVDADDWIEKNMYANMMYHIKEKELDMILCGMYRYFGEEECRQSMPLLKPGFYEKETIIDKVIPRMMWDEKYNVNSLDPSLCSKIFKRELLYTYLERASGLELYLGEDSAVVYPFMLEVERFFVIHDCYYYHRQREKGIVAPYIKDALYFNKIFKLYQYLKDQFDQSMYSEVLQKQLEFFYMRYVQIRKKYYTEIEERTEAIFPFSYINMGARVVLYGAGNVGKKYMQQNDMFNFCEIISWVDKNYRNIKFAKPIESPEVIRIIDYDYIIIAVQVEALAEEILEELLAYGVPKEKIIWVANKVQSFW